MARDRADDRRLNPAAALVAAARGLPAAWAGAWGVLIFGSLLIAAPVWVPLGGAMAAAWAAVLGVTALVAWGALTRIALGGDAVRGLGPGGLQFGAGELRIAAGLLLNLLFLAMIGVVLALATLAVFGAAGLDMEAVQARRWLEAGPGWKLAALAVAGLIALGVPVLLIVRLSLFAPASIGRGQSVSLNSMGIAHDAFWPLLALWGLIAGLGLAIPLAQAAGGLGWPAARLAAAVLVPWLWAPLAAGALADAYRQLEYWTPGEG